MGEINGNLVSKLIGNDIKAQVLGQMMELDIKPEMPTKAGLELVNALKKAVKQQDGEAAADAFEKHFDRLRAAMRAALEALQSGFQKQAV